MTVIQLAWRVPPLTLNQARRMHYYTEAKVKRTIIGQATTSIRRAKIEPMGRAEIVLHYRPGTKRICDSDGIAATSKCVIDALVNEGILDGDDWRYVPATTQRIHEPVKGQNGSMWVELREVES